MERLTPDDAHNASLTQARILMNCLCLALACNRHASVYAHTTDHMHGSYRTKATSNESRLCKWNAEERKNEYIHSKAATGIMHVLCAIVYVTYGKDIGISVIRISQFS